MADEKYREIFTNETLARLLPPEKSGAFFEALYGDAAEGAFDISLAFTGYTPGDNSLNFEFRLTERPGKCLACNLTYGLPEVFARHPIINVKGIAEEIGALLNQRTSTSWTLGHTRTPNRALHTIPLIVRLTK